MLYINNVSLVYIIDTQRSIFRMRADDVILFLKVKHFIYINRYWNQIRILFDASLIFIIHIPRTLQDDATIL